MNILPLVCNKLCCVFIFLHVGAIIANCCACMPQHQVSGSFCERGKIDYHLCFWLSEKGQRDNSRPEEKTWREYLVLNFWFHRKYICNLHRLINLHLIAKNENALMKQWHSNIDLDIWQSRCCCIRNKHKVPLPAWRAYETWYQQRKQLIF